MVALTASLMLGVGCTKDKRRPVDPSRDPTNFTSPRPVAPRSAAAGLLKVEVEVQKDHLVLRVKDVPPGSQLECELGTVPLSPCHDGAQYPRPSKDGDYAIAVDALRDGQRIATGQSPTFTISGGQSIAVDDPHHSLALKFTSPNIHHGMAVPKSKDFAVEFGPKISTFCAQPEFRCRHDGSLRPFWTTCDPERRSFTVKSPLIAMGPQEIGIQARCGDTLGPVLLLKWYGVPDQYQPLMIQGFSDGQGRWTFDLIRDQDCEGTKRLFECAETTDQEFLACPNGNILTNPPKGLRVRLACDGRYGPVTTVPRPPFRD